MQVGFPWAAAGMVLPGSAQWLPYFIFFFFFLFPFLCFPVLFFDCLRKHLVDFG
jgi:hypothetical protein